MEQVNMHALLAGAGAIPRRGLAGGIATCMILLHRQGNDHVGAAVMARLVDRGGLFSLLLQGDDHMEAVLRTRQLLCSMCCSGNARQHVLPTSSWGPLLDAMIA